LTDIACAIFINNGKLLLVRRASHKTWYPNHWDLVGGHVEGDETIEDALVREAEEEVGLTPVAFRWVAELSEPVESGGAAARYHVFVVTEWNGGEPELLGDEHTEMRWVDTAQALRLNDIAHPGYVGIFSRLATKSFVGLNT
jgi:mutator protein MutT